MARVVLGAGFMNRLRLHHLALLLLAVTTVACGDDSADGAGGGNAYSEDPVLDTEHEGGCETAEAFNAQCEAEGGIRTDTCQDAGCSGHGGRCASPPTDLTEGQFVCGDADVCAADQLCISVWPQADGCIDHGCAALPAACAGTPTCACLLENTASPRLGFLRSCTDAEGNVVYDEPAED